MSSDTRFRELSGTSSAAPDVERLLAQPVRITVGVGQVAWARQLVAICLVDLLGRLLPCLVLECDPAVRADPALPPGAQTLLERLEEARGHALIEPNPEPDGDPVLNIAVGTDADADADVHIDGDGWLSYLGEHEGELDGTDATNPIGPLVAACRGAAQVIQRVLGDRLPAISRVEESYWSALTLAPVEGSGAANPQIAQATIGAVLMGSGSIGGATAYALARVPELSGELVVADAERLEDRNSRKALLARRHDIEVRARKIDVARRELEHLPTLDVHPFEGTLAGFVGDGPRDRPLPLVICAVDSVPARRELADHMPLEALNAACGDTDIVVSGHRTDDGPCVYCLYIGDVLDTEKTRAKMIQRETGLPPGTIDQFRIKRVQLERQHLDFIENHRSVPRGSLAHRQGLTLDELFEEEFLYGEVRLQREEEAQTTLYLAFVPALAGVLLASEALKAGVDDALVDFRLGPHGNLGGEYAESLMQPPVGMLTEPHRWPDNACLCRSLRRLTLMRERYGLGAGLTNPLNYSNTRVDDEVNRRR